MDWLLFVFLLSGVLPPLVHFFYNKKKPRQLAVTSIQSYDTPSYLRLKDTSLTTEEWTELKGKTELVNKNYWRIHGKYYDLSGFVSQHPGGTDWLMYTKGTDCTEAFEVHHINIEKARLFLKNYEVGIQEAEVQSHFNFPKDCFYDTLRQRVYSKVGSNIGPTQEMKTLTWGFMGSWIASFMLLCYTQSKLMAVVCGLGLIPIWGLGHNYLHQKDSPLRWIVNLTTTTSYEWRVSHALSHHIFPNSQLDLEVTSLKNLFLYFLPSTPKPPLYKATVLLYLHLVCALLLPIFFFKNLLFLLLQKQTFRFEYFIPFFELLPLLLSSSSPSQGFLLFFIIHSTFSFFFVFLAWPVHHSHLAWHDGDQLKQYEKDYACFILQSTSDHSTDLSLIKALSLFAGLNDHTIHHLFPTLDRSRFNEVRPLLLQTCKDFNIPYSTPSFGELALGILQRITNDGPLIHNS